MPNLLRLLGLFFAVYGSQSLMGAVVTMQKGNNPWKLHEKFTDVGNHYRYSEYRRPLKNGSFRVLFKNEQGKVTRTQLNIFRKLWPGDQIVIPDRLVFYNEMVVKSQSINDVCKSLSSPPGCQIIVLAKNSVTDPQAPFTGTLLIPKKYQLIQAANLQAPKARQPTVIVTKVTTDPRTNWWVVGVILFAFAGIVGYVVYRSCK